MVRRGDVYGFMVEHFAKQGQYKQVGVIINIENHFNAKKNVIIIIDSMYWLFTGLQLDRGHEGEDSERECRLLHQPRHGQGNRTSCWSPAHR